MDPNPGPHEAPNAAGGDSSPKLEPKGSSSSHGAEDPKGKGKAERDNPPVSNSGRHIRLMADDCRSLFEEVPGHMGDLDGALGALKRFAEESSDRFEAWAAFLGVFGSEDTSLDHRLRRHEALQDMVMRLLSILRRSLFTVNTMAKRGISLQPSVSSEALSQKTGKPSILDDLPPSVRVHCLGVEESITRLNKLAIDIRASSRAPANVRARAFAASHNVDLKGYEHLADLALRSHYPNLPESLRQQLADAMTDRYAKLQYEAYRLGHPVAQAHKAEDMGVIRQVGVEVPALDSGANLGVDHRQGFVDQPSSLVPTTAEGRIHASVIPASSMDPLLVRGISEKTDLRATRMNEPPLPPMVEGSRTCAWCFQKFDRTWVTKNANGIETWTSEGRRHYRSDLRPYVCLAENCSALRPVFASDTEWHCHMRSAGHDSDDMLHSESWAHKIHQQPFWTCQGPHEGDSLYSFPTKKELTNHIAKHHIPQQHGSGRARHGSPDQTTEWTTRELMSETAETGNASQQLLSQLAEKYAAKSQRPASACPLCLRNLEKEPESHKLQDGKASCAWQVSSSALLAGGAIAPPELWRHIADHLHDLMILSLQLMTAAARVGDGSSKTKLPQSLSNRAFGGSVGRGVDDSRFPNMPSDLLKPSTRDSNTERAPSPSLVRSGLPSEGTTSPVGLKVLHDRPEAVIDICFVHGLTGDRESTWAAPGHEPWPITLLPSELQARILTYGYHAYTARASSKPSSDRLMVHAANLLRDLTADRAGGVERPLIFVAHSVGGLVCKEAMLHSRRSPEAPFRRIFERAKGIVFMGTPHKGAWTAGWAKIPASALGVARGIKESLLDILETDNEALESLHQRFSSMVRELQLDGRNPRITCFFEELPLPGIDNVIVSKESATFEGEDPIAIHANHKDIARFTSAEDIGFRRLFWELRKWESEVTQETQSASAGWPMLSRDWLAFPGMHDRYHGIDRAFEGTCEWLLRHKTFQSWAARHQGLLLIVGKPGSGKSTLLKHVLDNRRKLPGSRDDDVVLSFFFHGRGTELQRSPLGLFRCLLYQLLGQAPGTLRDRAEYFAKVRNHVEAFEKLRQDIGQSENSGRFLIALQGFFERSLRNVVKTRSVWLFIDALDELPEDNEAELGGILESLLQSSSSIDQPLRICVTCRQRPISITADCFIFHHEDENRNDIWTYVENQLSTFDRRTIPTILQIITARAAGVFMWARLVTNRVLDLEREGKELKAIEAAIRSTPPALDELYRKLIEGMGPDSVKLIQWICFSLKPLSTDELRWAMIVDPDGTYKSLHECRQSDDFVTGGSLDGRINALGRGLVEIVPSDNHRVVQFIHQSVEDFFDSNGPLLSPYDTLDYWASTAHNRLSKICIRYLAMEEIAESHPASRSVKHIFPFFDYARASWAQHARQSSSQKDLLGCFDWPSNALVERLAESMSYPTGTSLVHIASREQLPGLLSAIPQRESQVDVNSKDGDGRTPLSIAAEKGNWSIVDLLIEREANIYLADSNGQTPLWVAAEKGHRDLVGLLLGNGADIDWADSNGQTPLWAAADKGHQYTVQLLLNRWANVDLADSKGRTPLWAAADKGYKSTVELLLQKGASINLADSDGQTPLWAAANKGHGYIAELLVQKGANVNMADSNGQTPLWVATDKGHRYIVRLLVKKGANVNLADNKGRKPWWAAEKRGFGLIVDILRPLTL
ncbi:hypothetical protein MAPG_02597 [Magnaporthiopsis poae ATCC 64411]|uniref:NACHT domain-containing protein n=1 Tax=Magnaporthiopsis poae (strain ATCC 64411 / 73-15) TaxID=644358 RepID=A0A0C4DRT1_MAGP6|nr:hypothetical protein MAPG_02597 [Magnaporthiopsis poae ATCC 64411]